MKNLPVALKIIINIIFYIIYTIIGHFIFGFVFAFILSMLGKRIPLSTDPVFIKIGIVASFFVLALTLVFRRYFYIGLDIDNKYEEIKEQDIIKIKNKKKESKKKSKKEEPMKIYIEKEINN